MNAVLRLLFSTGRHPSWLPLLLRIPVGATFIVHGYGKVFERGILETASGFAQRGIPLGGVLGPIVPIAEFFGGILLIAGLGTRLWGLLDAGVMTFAILFVHWSQGFRMKAELVTRGDQQVAASGGWEWQALLLASCLVLAIGGGGKVSLDALIVRRLAKADARELEDAAA